MSDNELFPHLDFWLHLVWGRDLDRGDPGSLRVNLDFRNILRAWLRDVERPN